jgi:hypothetical protein
MHIYAEWNGVKVSSLLILSLSKSNGMAESVGTLHQWDYLFAFGVIFCALDAYNIGANE